MFSTSVQNALAHARQSDLGSHFLQSPVIFVGKKMCEKKEKD